MIHAKNLNHNLAPHNDMSPNTSLWSDSGTSATNNLYVHRDCASLKNIFVQLIDCHDVHYTSVCLAIRNLNFELCRFILDLVEFDAASRKGKNPRKLHALVALEKTSKQLPSVEIQGLKGPVNLLVQGFIVVHCHFKHAHTVAFIRSTINHQ
jgi:hypothetical protein